MLDLSQLDLDEIATALADQTDYERRWLIDPRSGAIVFWTSDTGIDGENPVDLDDLDLVPIDPLPSSVWYADMVDFAEGLSDDAAGRRLATGSCWSIRTLNCPDDRLLAAMPRPARCRPRLRLAENLLRRWQRRAARCRRRCERGDVSRTGGLASLMPTPRRALVIALGRVATISWFDRVHDHGPRSA